MVKVSMAALITIFAVLAATEAYPQSTISGPIAAHVESVYDGDTFTVIAYVWPGMLARTSIRVNGIDTPEIRGKCAEEKALAIRAKEFVQLLIARADNVILLANVKFGKYAGRVIADVFINNLLLSDLLIQNQMARKYTGGKRSGWCSV